MRHRTTARLDREERKFQKVAMAALSLNEIRARLAAFAERWKDAKDEDADAKSFWDDLFGAYGTNRRQVARFEAPIKKLDGQPGFIDVLWKGKMVVENKSRGKNLAAAKEQALDYIERLKPAERPRYLVTCDFARFEIHDLQTGTETKFTLEELSKHAEALSFIAGYEPKRPTEEAPVNIAAVERLGELYDEMKRGGYPDHDLQEFLVRILFCLFAEDTGVFEPDAFTDIILNRTAEDGSDLGVKLNYAFETLNSEASKRQKALDESLAILPYVNGALFARRLTMAATDSHMREALIRCTEFDWSKISPAIFGSLFQGVMDAAERRAAGAHYTAEENILKVIKPLFLDDLWAEFTAIKTGPKTGREGKLKAFHEKLARLKFFDPACGCGNFLIITYRELRKLEIEVLKELHPRDRNTREIQPVLNVAELSKINVDQFYGIEIDEFPAQIAKVALWLMDHVMNVELGYAFGQAFTRLPLTKSAHITNGNALQIDWKTVIAPEECSYILGNPPFIGSKLLSPNQKADVRLIFPGNSQSGVIDYVGCWYRKAVDHCKDNPGIHCAFVSTNSITQGEQVSALWPGILEDGLKILFAHRTFRWESEARGAAHVHVIIVGFKIQVGADGTSAEPAVLFDYVDPSGAPSRRVVRRINPYLIEGSDTCLPSRRQPLGPVSPMVNGSIPADGGHLLVDDTAAFLAAEPNAKPWLRLYVGADGLINGTDRHCLWLKGCPPHILRTLPHVTARVERVRESRLGSTKIPTQRKAATPTIFTEDRQPQSGSYLAIPRTSSENRPYIPIAFLSSDIIAANDLQMVPGATLYEFGVLQSKAHYAWTATVTGRLESRIRYSSKIAYNNFPWPNPTESQKDAVEKAAQAVLDTRAQFPDSSLADLYDPNTMPPILAKAHAVLDKAVEKAYRAEPFKTDRERVEYLFAMYDKMVTPLAPAVPPTRTKKPARAQKPRLTP